MCGLAGIYNRDIKEPVDQETLQALAGKISHRGPDKSGIYRDGAVGLAHHRLSIIDLEGGNQPMQIDDGALTIIYNGEIYNYLELRQELMSMRYEFSTDSDTEVILRAYQKWGEACVERFNGMWAFSILDKRAKFPVLFCSRDRMGIKPFYYLDSQDKFVFASEIKAFFSLKDFEMEVDPNMLWDALVFGPKPMGATIYKRVKELGPGQNAIVSPEGIKLKTYFNLATTFTPQSPKVDLREIEWLIKDAIRLRLRSDVPVATMNSGGIDSSLITSFASNYIRELHTYSVAPEPGDGGEILPGDESYYAHLIADFLETDHKTIRYGRDQFQKEFDSALFANDGAMFHSNSIPMKILFRKIKSDGITVILGGEGADEVFRGYYSNKILHMLKFTGSVLGKGIMYVKYKNRNHLLEFGRDPRRIVPFIRNNFFSKTQADELLGINGEVCEDRAEILDIMSNLSPSNGLAYYEQVSYLGGLLQRADRMSMAHGVELRVPFLDYRLVEKLNGIKQEEKCGRFLYREKQILKSIGQSHLPKKIVDRKKYGFASPINQYKSFLKKRAGRMNLSVENLSENQLWLISALTLPDS